MLCVRCGQDNPEGAKYCSKCNAMMPQAAPEGLPGQDSTLELDEQAEYPVPEQRYENAVLQELAWAAHDVLEEEGEIGPVVEAYEVFLNDYAQFAQYLPRLQEMYYKQKNALGEDDRFATKANYLLTKAQMFYEKGTEQIDKFLDAWENDEPDPDDLRNGVRSLLDCNDHLAVALQLNTARMVTLAETLDVINAKLGKRPPAEEEAAAAAPVDSSDIG